MQIPKDPRELEIALKKVADNVRSRWKEHRGITLRLRNTFP